MAISLSLSDQHRKDFDLLVEARQLLAENRVDEAWQRIAETESSPDSLLALKRCAGADFIRKYNMNTTLADQEFGAGWLDD